MAMAFGGPQAEKEAPKSAWLIMADGYVRNDGGQTAMRVEITEPVYKYIGDLKPGASFKAPPTKFHVRYGAFDPWVGLESKELTFTPDYGLMEMYEKRKQRVQSMDARYSFPYLFITIECDEVPIVEIMTQEPEVVQRVGPDMVNPKLESSFKPRSFKIEGLNIKMGKETVFNIIPSFTGDKEQVDVPIKITIGDGPTQEVHVVTYVFMKKGNDIDFGRLGNHVVEPKRLGEANISSAVQGSVEKEEKKVIQVQPIWLVIFGFSVVTLIGVVGYVAVRMGGMSSRAPAVEEIPKQRVHDTAAPSALPAGGDLGPMEKPIPVETASVAMRPASVAAPADPPKSRPPVTTDQALVLGEKIRKCAKTLLAHFKKHPEDLDKFKKLNDKAQKFSDLPDDEWLQENDEGVLNVQAGRVLLMQAARLTKGGGEQPQKSKPKRPSRGEAG